MKNILLAVGFLNVAYLTTAQRPVRVPHSFVSAGVTFPTVGGGDSWKFGLVGGQAGLVVIVDPGLEHGLTFQGEAAYSMQGSKYQESSDLEGKVSINYIIVPLVLQYRSEGGFYVEGGVQPGFRLSAKNKYDGETYDFKEETEALDFGIPVGIGFLTGAVGVNLRYTHGLRNILKGQDVKEYNQVFALRLLFFSRK